MEEEGKRRREGGRGEGEVLRNRNGGGKYDQSTLYGHMKPFTMYD
jgi:hypothetical protein